MPPHSCHGSGGKVPQLGALLPFLFWGRVPLLQSRSSAEDLDLRVGDLDMVESACRPPFFPFDVYIYIVMYMYIMSLILVLDNLSTRGP